MYAVIRVNRLDPAKAIADADALREFDELHSEQPGFLGSIVVDLDGGRQAVVNLWESEQHGQAGLAVLGPAVGRLLAPLMAEPSQLVGAGTATTTGGLHLTSS